MHYDNQSIPPRAVTACDTATGMLGAPANTLHMSTQQATSGSRSTHAGHALSHHMHEMAPPAPRQGSVTCPTQWGTGVATEYRCVATHQRTLPASLWAYPQHPAPAPPVQAAPRTRRPCSQRRPGRPRKYMRLLLLPLLPLQPRVPQHHLPRHCSCSHAPCRFRQRSRRHPGCIPLPLFRVGNLVRSKGHLARRQATAPSRRCPVRRSTSTGARGEWHLLQWVACAHTSTVQKRLGRRWRGLCVA